MKHRREMTSGRKRWIGLLAAAPLLVLALFLAACEYFDPFVAAGRGEVWLLWSNNEGQIWKMGLEGTPPEAVIDDQALIFYSDVVIAEGAYQVYWSEGGMGRIWRADLDGQNREEFFNDPAVTEVRNLALDPREGYLYWCTGAGWQIQRKPLAGGTVQTVHRGAMNIDAVALDLVNNLIYFAEGTSILRSVIGVPLNVEVFRSGVGAPSAITGITVDNIGWNVYWADQGLGEIHVQQRDGSGHAVLVSGSDVRDVAVDNYAGRLYWSRPTAAPAIMSAFLDGTDVTPLVDPLDHTPYGVFLDLWP